MRFRRLQCNLVPLYACCTYVEDSIFYRIYNPVSLPSKRQPGKHPSFCPAGQGGRRTVGLDVHLDRGGSSVPLRLDRHGVPTEHVPVVELDANVSPVGNVHHSRSQLGVDVLHPEFRGGCRPPFRLGHFVAPPVRGRKRFFGPQHARVIEVLLGEDVVDEVQRRLELLRHVPLAREEQFRPLVPHTDLDAEVVRFTLESRKRPVKDQLPDIGLQDHRFGSLGREFFHLWVGQRVKHFPNGDVGFLPDIGKEVATPRAIHLERLQIGDFPRIPERLSLTGVKQVRVTHMDTPGGYFPVGK